MYHKYSPAQDVFEIYDDVNMVIYRLREGESDMMVLFAEKIFEENSRLILARGDVAEKLYESLLIKNVYD